MHSGLAGAATELARRLNIVGAADERLCLAAVCQWACMPGRRCDADRFGPGRGGWLVGGRAEGIGCIRWFVGSFPPDLGVLAGRLGGALPAV